MRILISHIKSTTMSIRKAFKGLYSEVDELKERLQELEKRLSGESAEDSVSLSAETYPECEDKERIVEFAESLGVEVDKRKGIETIKSEIEEKLQGE